MNYVAIDPSLSCTAMVVNGKMFVYTTATVAHTKKGELKNWFQRCVDEGVTIHVWDDIPEISDNSTREIMKLERYSNIANKIYEDIVENTSGEIYVAIEGFSHSSKTGPLIDLVTISTLIRLIVLEKEWKLGIYQPTEVKRMAAAMVYPPIKKGKKVEYRNLEGVAGGSFKKPEIYKALIDNPNFKEDEWIKFLEEIYEEVFELKSIPKPIEDLNDAKTLYEIIKNPPKLDK